jgi:hypothetical protein
MDPEHSYTSPRRYTHGQNTLCFPTQELEKEKASIKSTLQQAECNFQGQQDLRQQEHQAFLSRLKRTSDRQLLEQMAPETGEVAEVLMATNVTTAVREGHLKNLISGLPLPKQKVDI